MSDPSTTDSPLPLFQGYGVELEYIIADALTLQPVPISDELLRDAAGTPEYVGDTERGDFGWSNELTAHLIELKTNGPAAKLEGLSTGFHQQVRHAGHLLAKRGARLLPGAMHPLLNPATDTRLWAHEYSAVYEAFNRIFGCKGHGWSNLQSTHINLPFANDDEFGRLHAAIRLVLPIIPALAAASPVVEGAFSGHLDTRLHVYRSHTGRIPATIGAVIPEPVFTKRDYDEQIMARMFRHIAPFDAEGVLQHEFLNARGAIGRWSRNAIEIRVVDIAECPAADMAVVRMIVAAVRALVEERWAPFAHQCAWQVGPLEDIFVRAIDSADEATIDDPAYLRMFGLAPGDPITAGELWMHLADELDPCAEGTDASETGCALDLILEQGPLARRLLRALNHPPPGQAIAREMIVELWTELAGCLDANRPFVP